MYYVYFKQTGRLLTKTNDIKELNKYLPSQVTVVIY
jgi:hypothetical protein